MVVEARVILMLCLPLPPQLVMLCLPLLLPLLMGGGGGKGVVRKRKGCITAALKGVGVQHSQR